MTKSAVRVYSIAPGGNFLRILAAEVLRGFPFGPEQRQTTALSNWTILLPTRRATRILGSILRETCGRNALLLPAIKPIGDIDDDRLDDEVPGTTVQKAISRTGQIFLMLDLLKKWAAENPQTAIASEIQNSHIQSLNLATSLLKLVDQLETEEADLEHLAEAYQADLSDHRTTILSLLGLLKIELPTRLAAENLMGPSARRSFLIRLEAQRINQSPARGPIIAAGSTGTIPATRLLLKAIAHNDYGSVILPGLDFNILPEDWEMIGSDHPQFSLRTLITELGIERRDVSELSAGNQNRNLLSAEIMRPSATSEKWHEVLKLKGTEISVAMQNLNLLAAPDRHLEARSIALILRHVLETPNQTAALITPDRDLAQRVKAELLRWDIVIDDSAGESLSHYGLASLAMLVLKLVANNVSMIDLVSLLAHPDCTLDLPRLDLSAQAQKLEIAVLRSFGAENGLDGLRRALARALEGKRKKVRVHPVVDAFTEDDWLMLQNLIDKIANILAPLMSRDKLSGDIQIAIFEKCLNELAPSADRLKLENQYFESLVQELRSEAKRLPRESFAALAPIITHVLHEKKIRISSSTHPRLAIYGVLEARHIPADVLILGGLNEGHWPVQTDPGPWFNRPMRKSFGLPQPERDIGLSAHDFTQALGYGKIYLTWSQRLNGSPQLPSRWILRLQTVMQAAGLVTKRTGTLNWLHLAKTIDASSEIGPIKKPKPQPPVAARPIRFSVTEIEKLIRDPYAIYAKRILRLEPLKSISRAPDAALRGTLFHEALKNWNHAQPDILSTESLNVLIASGRDAFAALKDDPEIISFWWPRFIRLANWVSEKELEFREDLHHVFAEIEGKLEFVIDGEIHLLTARADRIDLLNTGQVRIIDYKSGKPPTPKEVISGLSPQMPLEAAIVAAGGFKGVDSRSVSTMVYVHITGAIPAGKSIEIIPAPKFTADQLAQIHLGGLKSLLGKYRDPSQSYLPRVTIQKEDEMAEYDHLSRHREWILAGE
jgi:ATP-dependent helicase/nuclease subunit B